MTREGNAIRETTDAMDFIKTLTAALETAVSIKQTTDHISDCLFGPSPTEVSLKDQQIKDQQIDAQGFFPRITELIGKMVNVQAATVPLLQRIHSRCSE